MKKVLQALAAISMILSLNACSSSTPAQSSAPAQTTEAAEPAKPIKIGVAVSSWTTNAIFVDASRMIQEAADKNGWDYNGITLTADSAVNILENFINSDCDIILFQVNQAPDAFASKLDEMLDAGICVIEYDSEIYADKDTFCLTLDNYDAGYFLGELVAKWCDENVDGEAVIGVGNRESNETFKYRAMGIVDGINENIKNGGVKLQVETQPGNAEGGMKAAEDLLSGLPDMNVCVMWNGGSDTGAYEALKGANWDGALFGFDASQEEIKAMMNKDILKGSVSTNCGEELLKVIERAVEYVENGREYTAEQKADPTLIKHYFEPVMVWQEDAENWLLD